MAAEVADLAERAHVRALRPADSYSNKVLSWVTPSARIRFEGHGEEGEATVKTFKRGDGHVWLMPHNPVYEPILGDEAKILGRVVSVLRRI